MGGLLLRLRTIAMFVFAVDKVSRAGVLVGEALRAKRAAANQTTARSSRVTREHMILVRIAEHMKAQGEWDKAPHELKQWYEAVGSRSDYHKVLDKLTPEEQRTLGIS